jgi:poly(3-hydroxybutyrate) depolymerase
MTTTAPQIRHSGPLHSIFVGALILVLTAASAAAGTVSPTAGSSAAAASVKAITITYTAWNGVPRTAELLLPSWYTPSNNPPLPLVISPHGRDGHGHTNAEYWGTLPTTGGFAVVNPDGMGLHVARSSFGYRGQIDDLAKMPGFVATALPWVHVDPERIFALGSSMGGQETLLLVARHPHLLAGAAALDSVTDLVRRYGQMPLIAGGTDLQSLVRREVGGTPAEKPSAYAARSPLSQARAIVQSGVPLQIWWSKVDRIVVDQEHQSGTLFRRILQLGPCAPVKAYVGRWRHSSEMRSTSLLPLALIEFGLLPAGYADCPPAVQQLV